MLKNIKQTPKRHFSGAGWHGIHSHENTIALRFTLSFHFRQSNGPNSFRINSTRKVSGQSKENVNQQQRQVQRTLRHEIGCNLCKFFNIYIPILFVHSAMRKQDLLPVRLSILPSSCDELNGCKWRFVSDATVSISRAFNAFCINIIIVNGIKEIRQYFPQCKYTIKLTESKWNGRQIKQ